MNILTLGGRMKNLVLKISCTAICIVGIITGIISLKIDSSAINVVSTNSENIDSFISSIASTLLSVYEIDITNDVLDNNQKKYITDMYILGNRDKYNSVFTDDEGRSNIKSTEYNQAYYYLFGEEYEGNDVDITLNDYNTEKFHISSYKILSYKSENDVHILEVMYIQAFAGEEYRYTIRYNIGFKNGKYYLIGFRPID